jgi:hypothetical protein
MNIPPEEFPELYIRGGTATIWVLFFVITIATLVLFGMFGMLECECCYYNAARLRRRRKRLGK